MASRPPSAKISFDEYLRLEEAADGKSEYRCGEVFAMSGGTSIHSQIQATVIWLLRQHKPTGCRVYTSELKVFAPDVNEGMYPDASLVCGDLVYYGKRNDVILNPVLVVEVLSPSTRDYDLSMKASFYRTIPTVATILLVDSERRWIQRQTRAGKDWTLSEFTEPDQVVWRFENAQITLAAIYDDVSFAPDE